MNLYDYLNKHLSKENKDRLVALPPEEQKQVLQAYFSFMVGEELKKQIKEKLGKEKNENDSSK